MARNVIKGKMSVSMARGSGPGGSCTVVEITDESSGKIVCRVELSPEQSFFANGGLGHGEGLICVGSAPVWGKTHEFQEVVFTLPDWGQEALDHGLASCMEPYARQGWEVSEYDRNWNNNRAKRLAPKGKYGVRYSVPMHRYIDNPSESEDK